MESLSNILIQYILYLYFIISYAKKAFSALSRLVVKLDVCTLALALHFSSKGLNYGSTQI